MFPSERLSEWLWQLLPETCLRRCHTSMVEFFVKVVLLTSMYSWHCSGVSNVNFEQVNVGWVFWIIRHQSHKEFLPQKELDPETSFTRFCNVSKMLWMSQLSFDPAPPILKIAEKFWFSDVSRESKGNWGLHNICWSITKWPEENCGPICFICCGARD